jgi:hypothetical protein
MRLVMFGEEELLRGKPGGTPASATSNGSGDVFELRAAGSVTTGTISLAILNLYESVIY